VAWAQAKRPELDAVVAAHRATVEEATTAHDALVAALRDACAALGITAGVRPRDDVVGALARATTAHEQLTAQVAEAERLRDEVEQRSAAQSVATSLANHLAANRFEQWVLDAVLRQLVEGATQLLLELSGGAYSLILDTKSRAFAVIDHVNADAVRGARTLSGGETFLASLALALALADQVALVAGSAARLETILLDEGFGTLDGDTLEVVASALEELGARGRMVGVVTHVRELAERMPVRYEITKVGGVASVDRVGA
jgi:exonuclease SbcC